MEQAAAFTMTNVGDRAVLLPAVRVRLSLPDGGETAATLGLEPLVIGTSPECDLVLADARVSRRHCELSLTQRGVRLRDLGSKNGTFVGEVSIVEALIPPGVTVTMGGSRLVTSLEGAPSLVTLSSSTRFGDALGRSVVMRALFATLERAAATSETILLLGESGTGKEVLAKAIHDTSPRRAGPFAILDCSAVAPSLVEAELFGHTRGAFTGAVSAQTGVLEQADGGTLFIDEIGELPLELQPKLLRALEARKVRRVGSAEWRSFDARIVAATHRNLKSRVAAGTFREDLYYRLAVVEVHVPPLRDRKDDIPLLVERFLAAQSPPRALDALPPHALELLVSHDWPGNVRELRNVVARLLVFPELLPQLADSLGVPRADTAPPAEAERAGGIEALHRLPLLEAREVLLAQFEKGYLTARLKEHGGNITRAAEAMGVSRQLIHRLVERYGLRAGDR